MTLPPEVEARFKRIEDVQLVITELHRRGEKRLQEEIDQLKWIQDAMARWMDKLATDQEAAREREEAAREREEAAREREEEAGRSTEMMRQAITDLARTVELYLRGRSNGNN